MVSVGVGFQHQATCKSNARSGSTCCAESLRVRPERRVKIQHRVDNRRHAARVVVHQVGDGPGGRVVKLSMIGFMRAPGEWMNLLYTKSIMIAKS